MLLVKLICNNSFTAIQGGQLYMAVCFWYLVKRDFSSVPYCTVAYTSVTIYKVSETPDHVYLVGLYLARCEGCFAVAIG